MKKSMRQMALAIAVACLVSSAALRAQQGAPLTPEQRDQRLQTEKELQSVAIVERKVMVPMRDGVRLATDIYRPKNASGKVPIVWVIDPYHQIVTVHRLKAKVRSYNTDEELSGDPELPGFRVPVARLFE